MAERRKPKLRHVVVSARVHSSLKAYARAEGRQLGRLAESLLESGLRELQRAQKSA